MRVLIACEFSGIVRDAFRGKGHDAWSCDLFPCESEHWVDFHHQGDVLDILGDGWDMMIAHPPCTHLALAGAPSFEKKRKDGRQQQGIDFFMSMINAPIYKICVESLMCIMSTVYRQPDQVIQPYYFGDKAQKTTWLWLKGLKPLFHAAEPTLFGDSVTHVDRGEFFEYTNKKTGERKRVPKWYADAFFDGTSAEDRSKLRSRTFQGIADAMADQWA